MSDTAKFFIGIDGGGTKCKARLEDANGSLLAETTVGPANAARDLSGSVSAILQAGQQLLKSHGDKRLTLADVHAGIGLAGVNLPTVKQQIEAIRLPFAKVSFTTDLHIACLGAHLGKNGAIVIIGTGSSGSVITDQQHWELGGHGFLVGDKGSGAWMGKEAISLTLETLDGLHPTNPLTTEVLNALQCSSAHDLVQMTLNAKPSWYAQLAPMVLNLAQHKQAEASHIVTQSARYISQLSRRLIEKSPPRLSFIGGISAPLMSYLDTDIQRFATPALSTPEQGAIILAKNHCNKPSPTTAKRELTT